VLIGSVPSLAALLLALALDIAWGEPPNAIHPVAWMGRVITWLEAIAPRRGAAPQFVAGIGMALLVPLGFASLGYLFLRELRPWPAAELVCGALLLKSTFALRALGQAAFDVRDALAKGRVPEARRALRSLCSRDASRLEEPELVAAVVESLAENASDSFVAPLFYGVFFGVPGAIFYRAVNTLDAMIGYRDRYEYLGKTAARFDDLLNFLPARMTAALLLVGGWFRRQDTASGFAVLRRDGGKGESPNAGRPMAAIAGLLRVQLEKPGHYRIGEAVETLAVGKIDDAWRTVLAGSCVAASLAFVVLRVGHV